VGADLGGSNFAAQFMTLVAFGAASFVLGWLIATSNRYQFAAACATCCLLFVICVYLLFPHSLLVSFALSPGVSLKPIRSLLPYLIAGITWAVVRKVPSLKVRYILLGAASGICLLWSNDFAYPAAGLLFCLCLMLAAHQRHLTLSCLMILSASAVTSASASLLFSTMGHLLEFLRYNFLDIATDQWWYFGSWRESRRIFSVFDVYKIFRPWDGLSLLPVLAVLASVVYVAWSRRSMQYSLLAYIGLTLFVGGLIASAGGHLDFAYFIAFMFWSILTAAITTIVCVIHIARVHIPEVIAARCVTGVYMTLACVSILLAYGQASAFTQARFMAANDSGRFYVSELGGYLPVEWRDYVGAARKNVSASSMEEYWGIWSAIRHTPAPIPVDSVIHALGTTRNRVESYVATLPDIVISTRRSLSPEWQPWSLSANWWFYQYVLKNYHPVMLSPTTILWERHEAKNWPSVACTANATDRIRIDTADSGLYEVEVDYRFEGSPNRSLLFVRNNINMALGSNGYLSLDPHATKAAFPVLIRAGTIGDIDFKIQSASSAKVALGKCTARKIDLATSPLLSQVISE